MKTKNQMKPLARFIATSLAVGTMTGFGAQVLAQTAAGTLIKNLATVSYEDENGNSYSAQSNEAVVTVAPVYSATVENDNTLSGSPGQTVYFPHILSNTGNIEDTYTVGAAETSVAPVGATPVVYLDSNNNGQPDPGEDVVTSVTVPAGEQVNLVVAFQVPTNAQGGTVLSTELTATSANLTAAGSAVTDSGTNSDTTDGTNDDIVNVSTGPVLVLNKSSVLDEATNTITYTLTVKNNGATDAKNVNIIDPIPKADTTGDGEADTQLNFVSVAVNGLLAANNDTIPTATTSIDEAKLGDMNADGVTETLDGIIAKDLVLPPNTTVSVVYQASYLPGWAAGSNIENTFSAFDDPDGDGKPTDPTDPSSPSTLVPSNTTNDVIPQTYDVDALDTNTGSSPGVNDGGDDDSVGDNQFVDVAPTGSDVLFKHIITNNGNGDDTFNLDIANPAVDGFPAGTTFTFWDSTGTVQLTDSDNDGIPDTGVLGKGESETIMVKAKLPAGEADDPSGPPANGYNATLTATSSEDPSATPASNDTNLMLGSILKASVDVANVTADQGLTGFNDTGAVNAQDEAPVVMATGSSNSTVTFELQLANESGNADSFLLSADNIPAGWDVVFKDANTGNIITTTPLVPGKGVFEYTAEVTIPDDKAQALSNADQVGAVDGIDKTDDGSTNLDAASQDGDLDYQMNFTATSSSSPSVTDSVTNAVDIIGDREVVITPNGQNQVQPGGTVEYTHQLENNGNQPESVKMEASNTLPGWTTVINVDTTGDGIPDSILNAPAAGTSTLIKGVDEDGNPVDIEVTNVGGVPVLNLEPGENVPMSTTVTSPSDAPLGAVDLATVTVTDADTSSPTAGETLSSSKDQTTVMLGQVRLDKTAAIDEGCDGAIETGFEEIQTVGVKPGDCVVWSLTATNEGTATVKNVKISDAAPEFTDYLTGSLKFCQGNGCTLVAVDDASNGDQGTYSGGLVKFFANGGASDPANGIGGELISGEKMSGQFTVKIQK